MTRQSEYQDFRANFMGMIGRFDSLAPALVRSGSTSAAIALRTGRVVSLLDQALPDDDDGALTDQDHALLNMAMVRVGELMDVLDPMAATAEARPPRFDDEVFGTRLRSVDPCDFGDLVGVFSLVPGGKGKKETLDIICTLIEGFDDIFKGSIFETIKKILMIILQVLAGRTVLPQKVVDLIPTIFKFIDRLIDGDGDGGVPPEGAGDPMPVKPLGLVVKLTAGVPQEFDLPAGKQVIVTFESSNPPGRGVVGITGAGNPIGLGVGASSDPITGPARIRLNLSAPPGTTAHVRLTFC